MAERCPITGTSLYLVLLSNGLHRPKIRLKKFGFSPKIVPANIAKKLPPQRCFKPLFIAFFNFSRKRPMFAFTDKNGYTLGSAQRIAHEGLHGETGAFPPSTTVRLCAASEILFIPSHFYIHTFPGFLWPPTISRREKVGKTAATALSPNRFSSQFSTSRTNAPRLLSHSKAGTHSPFGEKSHTTAHTPKHGPSGRGRYHYPRHELHVHKHPRAGCQNGKLCRF